MSAEVKLCVFFLNFGHDGRSVEYLVMLGSGYLRNKYELCYRVMPTNCLMAVLSNFFHH